MKIFRKKLEPEILTARLTFLGVSKPFGTINILVEQGDADSVLELTLSNCQLNWDAGGPWIKVRLDV